MSTEQDLDWVSRNSTGDPPRQVSGKLLFERRVEVPHDHRPPKVDGLGTPDGDEVSVEQVPT